MGQEEKRAEIVGEYLKGGVTLRSLGKKHGINFRTIHRWVKEDEGLKGPGSEEKKAWRGLVTRDAELGSEVKRLKKELEEARLYNRLLNTMIDIAEEQFEIPIRKKPGAKRR